MPRRTPLFELLHAAFMCLWIGAAVTSGVAAAVAFPTMRLLNPRLPDYASYEGEHWRLAGGKVMAPVFDFAGTMQLACVTFAALAFAIARWPRPGLAARPLTLLRAGAVVLLIGVTGYQAAALRPRMMSNLYRQWQAAKAGDNAAAQQARAVFDADHGLSNTILGSGIALGLICVALAAAASMPRPEPAP